MKDLRVEKLADILVDYSTGVKKDDLVLIDDEWPNAQASARKTGIGLRKAPSSNGRMPCCSATRI
mgnify:CR=1 FL=1